MVRVDVNLPFWFITNAGESRIDLGMLVLPIRIVHDDGWFCRTQLELIYDPAAVAVAYWRPIPPRGICIGEATNPGPPPKGGMSGGGIDNIYGCL